MATAVQNAEERVNGTIAGPLVVDDPVDGAEPKKDAKKDSIKRPEVHLDKGTGTLKVVFSKVVLSSLVDKVAQVAPSSASNAILTHVLMDCVGGDNPMVALVSTDQERSVIARTTEAEIEVAGQVVIPMADLQNIADLSDTTVTFDVQDGTAKVTTEDCVWLVQTVDSTLFPKIPTIGDSARPISTANLAKALNIVSPAVGSDESRPALMMISFDSQGIYATDGTRVHFAAMPNEFDGLHIPALAVKPLQDLLRRSGSDYLHIEESDTHILFAIEEDEFTCRLMDQGFPPVRNTLIAPKLITHKVEVALPRQRLLLGLKRARKVSDDGGVGSVSLKIQEKAAYLSAANAKGNKVLSGMESDYSGDPRQTQYLIGPLMDLLAVVSDETITLRLSPSERDGSILVHTPQYTIVILPRMRS